MSPRRSVPVRRAEVDFTAVRSQGAGGQNVNKVSSAAHLRFDIGASSLPDEVKLLLQALPDQRISGDGVVVIKSQTHRSLPRNQADALGRLQVLVDTVCNPDPLRVPTRPTRAAGRRRLEGKARRGAIKSGRQRVTD
ncbi:MAG: alternative ribosome rescue aminoacyl-tRNA hydrolase ArfB [Rubrivivax sp.]